MLTLRTATQRQNPSVSGFCGTFPLGFFEDRDFFFSFLRNTSHDIVLYITHVHSNCHSMAKTQMVRFGTFKRSEKCGEVAETAE